jgi:hypothetical protein
MRYKTILQDDLAEHEKPMGDLEGLLCLDFPLFMSSTA